jgi:hypothetical protein
MLDKPEKLDKEKHSSLFLGSISAEERRFFV